MMRYFNRIRAIFIIAFRRLLAQPILTVTSVIGLSIAVGLILTIPIYAESIAYKILTERLADASGDTNRPPFSYLINYIGSWNDPINWEEIEALDTYLSTEAGDELGLQVNSLVRHFETESFRLYPAGETAYDNEDLALDYVTFAMTDNIVNHIDIIEGQYPQPAEASTSSVIEILVHEQFAIAFGIQVGDSFLGYNWRLSVDDVMQTTEIQVAGVWKPTESTDSFWFYRPDVFEDMLIVHQDTYLTRINPYTEQDLNLALWYLVADGRDVNTGRVDELIERQSLVTTKVDQLLPGTTMSSSPVNELRPYQRIVRVLTLTLTVFSVPIVALLIVFLMMVVRLVVDRQRNETAVLRSRGTSPFQIVGLAAIEGLIIGSIALLLGTGLATIFTQLMGSTKSFLDFSYQSSFVVSFPPTILTTAGLALLFTMIIRILPTISASRHTIISYKLDNSRLLKAPIWQRMGLDILLLVIIAYSYYQIVQQGSLINIEGGISNIEEAYEQPFVFLLPPLTIFALTLFTLRILPLILRFTAWVIQLTDSVGLLIVTRQLARSPGTYFLPLILLVSTISLGIYTASFARTIDRYLYEQQFYRTGADLSIRVFGSSGLPTIGGITDGDAVASYIHISEFNNFEGIDSATRFGEYHVRARLNSGTVEGSFFGIDRTTFGEVAFWRPDFAPIRLGYLLNSLARENDTVLVTREFMEDRNLNIGDFVELDVGISGETVNLNLQIAGTFDYFPFWYPEEDGDLFVGNLDYIFEQAQAELAHRVIVRLNSNFDERAFRVRMLQLGASSVSLDEPFTRIEREQARPERQGLFGLLSIGFITSSLATVIGFLLYTVFSYQKRYVELGILRAIGLSQLSMIVSVAWELLLLIVMGLTSGISIGLIVSMMYIPYMQFVSSLTGIVPPYIVMIAWTEIAQIVALFVITFMIIMLVLLFVLRRMRIFQAVKLGESI